MRTTYSVHAWTNRRRPADFTLERLGKRNARIIFNSFCNSGDFEMVTLRKNQQEYGIETSEPISNYNNNLK